MARQFNPTNKPGTCRYCGCKLKHDMIIKSEPTARPASCRKCGAGDLWPDRGHFVCYCGELNGRTSRIVERTNRYDLPGHLGNGEFCTQDCGYRFALTMVKVCGKVLSKKASY